ncbi:SipW-dependent-type signal peptide-containing protein [Halodesulfurarchaeum sp. HSR-GB]|uniref:SipW-dependent-type signal peptide-containing protein n=1 Tax=Halodesulfurarchaeum sp. HSR-GB TaxID=3074077 RepID=UPI00286205F3|nr:SipW-dependent-type signal peptide-containing protein [Halodesulfurarchaeum sp. HSR-GB]MDR5657340.1 SipW-dependent-type signal peptide-containing protein [Halodesulfurarchaeum sp. HSR-GB]
MSDENNTFEISRRKTLAALGTIGAASAGAGLGTSAWFSDTETFEGNTITAGELDLKVDWEEHYYDGSSGGEFVSYSEPSEGDNVALPDPEDPQVWVPRDSLGEFMDATALEAFPDPDGDGIQEMEYDQMDGSWTYDPCSMGADTPEDLDPKIANALRTDNGDTYDEEAGEYKPLIALDDVKPGDFGELTFSLHLCDNPGYLWMQAGNVTWWENDTTEPEAEADGETGGSMQNNTDGADIELADAIKTVWWYDARGDNVIQDCGEETLYLTDSVSGSDTSTRLFEVTLTEGNAELVELYEDDTGNFNQTDAIAATLNGDAILFFDKSSHHLGRYDIGSDAFDDLGEVDGATDGIVLAGHSPSGTLWAASQDDDNLYTIDPSGPSMTAMGDTGIDIQGADLVFAADGTMYIWTAATDEAGLYKVDDPASDTTAEPVDEANIGDFTETITGLAIRGSGTGQLVGSDRENDAIVTIDRTDGSIIESYPMQVGDEAYDYDYGDMTSGKFCGEVFHRGTLGGDLAALSSGNGIPLDGNRATPFDEIGGEPASDDRDTFVPGVNHYIGFAWYVPPEVGNEIQTDAVEFDLGFYTEQARHNDGAGMENENEA